MFNKLLQTMVRTTSSVAPTEPIINFVVRDLMLMKDAGRLSNHPLIFHQQKNHKDITIQSLPFLFIIKSFPIAQTITALRSFMILSWKIE
jgi:hypothetical protein